MWDFRTARYVLLCAYSVLVRFVPGGRGSPHSCGLKAHDMEQKRNKQQKKINKQHFSKEEKKKYKERYIAQIVTRLNARKQNLPQQCSGVLLVYTSYMRARKPTREGTRPLRAPRRRAEIEKGMYWGKKLCLCCFCTVKIFRTVILKDGVRHVAT